MSRQKAKEFFYSLDPFPTNPTWRIDTGFYLSTWKSLIATFLILAVSLGLSYESIREIFTDKSLLPIAQVYEATNDGPPSPFYIGLSFASKNDVTSIDVAISDVSDSGNTSQLHDCPAELSGKTGWTVCYLVNSKKMPFPSDANPLQSSAYITLTVTTAAAMTVYLEKFSIKAFLGSGPRQFFTLQTQPGLTYTGTVAKAKLAFKDSVAESDSTQYFTGLIHSLPTSIPSILLGQTIVTMMFNPYVTDTSSFTITRNSVFDMFGTILGWIQIFSLALFCVFYFVNVFNTKLQIARALFTNKEILEAKVSLLFYIKMVVVYAMDIFGCKRCERALKAKGYLRQEFLCYAAFERQEGELSIDNIHRSLSVLRTHIRPRVITDEEEEQYHFDYRLEAASQDQNQDNTALFNMLSTQRYTINKVNKQKLRKPKVFVQILRWFDLTATNIEFNLYRPQRSSALSIIVSYGWIAATIAIVCTLGALSVRSTPTVVYQRESLAYSYQLDFSKHPIYLRQESIYPTNNLVEFNVSLIDSNYKLIRKLDLTAGTDCPPPSELFTQNGTVLSCLAGTVELSHSDDLDINLLLTIAHTRYSSKVQIQMTEHKVKDNLIYPIVRKFLASGGSDSCQSFKSNGVIDNNENVGLSISQFGDHDLPCSQLYDNTDRIFINAFLFEVGSTRTYRESTPIDFFTVVNEGWNISLLFSAVFVYLLIRPFNKWKARKSVALGTPLREEEHVEKLLDLTNLLLYIRAKESVMGTDRFFFKRQIKLQ